MALLDWLKEARRKISEHPKVLVAFDDERVTCDWPDGDSRVVTWDDLSAVVIHTTDTGPFAEDVFLVLDAADGGCIIPQEAEGFPELIERLQQLTGFDNEALISAMTCTDNATFPCWRRGPA